MNNQCINLHDIYNQTQHNSEPPWEFPKGRRLPHEHDRNVAIREFYEETGLNIDTRHIQNTWFEHTFCGSDNNEYTHIFYHLELDRIVPVYLDPNNVIQCSEVKKCGWFTSDTIVENNMFEGIVEEQKKYLLNAIKS